MVLMPKTFPENTSNWRIYSEEARGCQKQATPLSWTNKASETLVACQATQEFEQRPLEASLQASPLNLDSTLEELTLHDACIDLECTAEEVSKLFEANPLLPGIIIADGGNFVGMISRRQFFECMSRPYSLELFSKRPVLALYSFAQSKTLVCDRNASIVETVQQSLERSPESICEPIVVQLSGAYKLLDVHQLLYAHSQIHQLATEALRLSEAQSRQQATKLEQTLHELQRTQTQLIQTEKMSSLGQIVAGVAHEVNNSVNYIHGNLAHASDYAYDLLHLVHLYAKHYPEPVPEIQEEMEAIDLDFLMLDLPKLLSSMQLGSERICDIVLSLRNFSRLDEAEGKAVDIHEGIDSTLLFLQNRLKGQGQRPDIVVHKEYGDLPLVACNAGELNQAFMNILCNAIEAVEMRTESVGLGTRDKGQGTGDKELGKSPSNSQSPIPNPQSLIPNPQSPIPQIQIRTEVGDNNQVLIRITDNGVGMTSEVQQRLFDPFFTTKPVGKGSGLGLSISYQIVVEKHCGKLTCVSEPGIGTEFLIEIPIQQSNCESTLSRCA
ncbi:MULTISPECIES: ATP-binding protein [Cyanophyceae]|uniref:ATP-binding protein n=1 Tax=Cyanophyceae TaxID=3028117 RepID=UPI0018EF5FBA|nr:ATP-binding protein [Trichocoleus sp. FACHB-40]